MIHQYVNNGYHIVLDVNSGSVHVVDELCYDVIQALDTMGIDQAENPVEELKKEETAAGLLEKLSAKYAESDLKDAYGDIVELTEAGQVVYKRYYEQYIGEVKQRKTVVKALCMHIAHDCNLACRYCFAEEGEYHGRRALMSFEVGKKGPGFSDCQFRLQKKPGGGFFWRRAADELAGGKRSGEIWKRAGKAS